MDWVRLELDVSRFDPAPFAPLLRQAKAAGVSLATMHEISDVRALYELNKICSGDIPGREEFYSYEDYVTGRINVPCYDAAGVILAMGDGQKVRGWEWQRLRFMTGSHSAR